MDVCIGNTKDVLHYYPPNKKFANDDGWKWSPMWIGFGIKKQYLIQKPRLIIGGHVAEPSYHTTCLSTIKEISFRLMFIIAEKNVIALMSGDIGN